MSRVLSIMELSTTIKQAYNLSVLLTLIMQMIRIPEDQWIDMSFTLVED